MKLPNKEFNYTGPIIGYSIITCYSSEGLFLGLQLNVRVETIPMFPVKGE